MAFLAPWLNASFEKTLPTYLSGKGHHALLLNGPAGVGKRFFAQALAQRLLCRQASNAVAACGLCKECALFVVGNHPDFYPVSIPEDKQSIVIEQIRDLSQALHQASHRSGYRIALIEPAEAMTIASANALLKTLEEPGRNTVLILVADDVTKVPATVRSRCQRLPFASPEQSEGQAWLKAHLNDVSDDDAKSLLAMASGAPYRALAYFESGALAQVQALESGLQAIAKGQSTPVSIAQTQKDIELALHTLQRIVIGGVQKSLAAESPLPADVWDRFAHAILTASQTLRRNTSVNGVLLLESVLAQWFDLTAFLRHSRR